MKNIYLLFILVLLPVIFAFDKADSTKVVKPIISPNSIVLTEGQAYKMLYENQVKSNDAILKTIFYALGGLGTAVLLVFGSTWWFNDKKVKDLINEINSKTEGIKKDILAELTEKFNVFSANQTAEVNLMKTKLQEEVTSNTNNLTSEFNTFVEKNRVEIKEDNRIMEKNYQDLLKSYSDNLSQQIVINKESLDNKIIMISDKVEENKKNFEAKLKYESTMLKRGVLKHDADIAFMSNLYASALSNYIKYAKLEIEIGYDWSFSFDSQDIIKCLKQTDYIYNDDFEALKSLLELTSSTYPELTEEIKKLYKDKSVKSVMK